MMQLAGLAGLVVLPFALLFAGTSMANEPIRIGQTAVLSGPMAPNVDAFNEGVRLYFDAVNRAGGIDGRPIELVSLDDVYLPDRARENAEQLIADESIVAMLGVAGTGVSMAVAPLVEAAGMPLVGLITGAPELRAMGGGQLFHVRATYTEEILAMVRYLKTIGITRLGAVYQADPFGQSALRQLEQVVAEEEVEIVSTASISGPEFRADEAVAEILRDRPGAVLLLTAGGASVEFIRLSHAAQYRPMFLGLSVVSTNALPQALGADAHGVIVAQVSPHPVSGKYPVVRDLQRLAAETGSLPDTHLAVEGFIASRILVEALRRADGEFTRQAITRALTAMGRFDAGGFEVDLSGVSGGAAFVDLSMLKADGTFAH